MLRSVLIFALFASTALSEPVKSTVGKLVLTVAYCPTEFTGAGAIVEVNPVTGNFTITGTFKWPSDIIGCPADYDPIVTLDGATSQLYLYFLEDDIVAIVDVAKAKLVSQFAPSDLFFTGFENMQYVASEQALKGVSGTVTQDGFCDDGCFQYGDLTTKGKYTKQQLVPFKAVLDDSHYYDESRGIYWIQASYDLRDTICGHVDSDECLLALDATSGALKSAVYTNFTVYKYGPADASGSLLAWVEGFDDVCDHPYDDFLFAKVDLPTATATPIACIDRNVTVHMDEWIASFSLDGSMMATGSGDAEAPAQLAVFNTTDASTVLNTDLAGLKQQLKTADGLFFVWSVDWINA
eukprot:TRINITY_DN2749_c0_g3_i1.p1 TRINITY_DN2749_c0_g3~~TRINITY_DN2749_c0_g3_i1.p1  ORF type:complete len:352 (+),score=147.19 TRINITY_DN2749_c0_g3_i1:124-1179(+)